MYVFPFILFDAHSTCALKRLVLPVSIFNVRGGIRFPNFAVQS